MSFSCTCSTVLRKKSRRIRSSSLPIPHGYKICYALDGLTVENSPLAPKKSLYLVCFEDLEVFWIVKKYLGFRVGKDHCTLYPGFNPFTRKEIFNLKYLLFDLTGRVFYIPIVDLTLLTLLFLNPPIIMT